MIDSSLWRQEGASLLFRKQHHRHMRKLLNLPAEILQPILSTSLVRYVGYGTVLCDMYPCTGQLVSHHVRELARECEQVVLLDRYHPRILTHSLNSTDEQLFRRRMWPLLKSQPGLSQQRLNGNRNRRLTVLEINRLKTDLIDMLAWDVLSGALPELETIRVHAGLWKGLCEGHMSINILLPEDIPDMINGRFNALLERLAEANSRELDATLVHTEQLLHRFRPREFDLEIVVYLLVLSSAWSATVKFEIVKVIYSKRPITNGYKYMVKDVSHLRLGDH